MSARVQIAFLIFLAVTAITIHVAQEIRERREAVTACVKLGRAPVECREAFDP